MLRDISDWERVGYGGKSTLEKEELRSPDREYFLIKYPRQFEVGISWEDITELIAAEIGTIMSLETMDVEIVIRNGRRGCLLKNFTLNSESIPIPNEEGGALLNVIDDYPSLLNTDLKGKDLIDYGFSFVKRLPYWESILVPFVQMQFFDVLIGNQDRHPYNWLLMFFSAEKVQFSPLYDNGASLGFRFDNVQLQRKSLSEVELNKYTKNTRVKAGLFEHKQVKAKDILNYLLAEYPQEANESISKLSNFDLVRYNQFISSLQILSEAQRAWLLNIIPFRRKKILEWVGREES